jgi:hypothetical protein
VSIARDLVVDTILETMRRIIDSRVSASIPEDVTRLILRALGLNERSVARTIAAPAHKIRRPNPTLT